jgi:hypothetical protein
MQMSFKKNIVLGFSNVSVKKNSLYTNSCQNQSLLAHSLVLKFYVKIWRKRKKEKSSKKKITDGWF